MQSIKINPNHIIFSIFIALIATLKSYYYADIDHIEQLPIILRKINSGYLTNDFFVNSTSGFGPRYYYTIFIAFFGRFLSLPIIFFSLTLISNIAVSLITISVSNVYFVDYKPIAYLAAILVMFVSTFSLGSDEIMSANALLPDRIAFPLIMLSFLFLIKNKIIEASFIAGIASIFHVLIGLGYGSIFILSYIIINFSEKINIRNYIKPVFFSALILFIFSLLTIIPEFISAKQKISDVEFISIIANFRHPHHYIPSHFFSFLDIIKATFFFVLASLSIIWIENKYPLKHILIISISILILLISGYVFVEIYPSRLFITLQTFRYLNILKWLSLIFISGFLFKFFRRFNILNTISIIFYRFKIIFYILFISISFLISLKIVYKLKFDFNSDFNNKYFNPKFSLSDYFDDETKIFEFIIKNTDKNDIFLSPPNFGKLRIFAQRAVIVDFKAFPFSDLAMKEWKNRIDNCYGKTNKSGFEALTDLENNYKNINTEKIKKLEKKYNFKYIILFSETKTELPVLYKNKTFKLVKFLYF
ncbi:MAG: hypothetical protein JXR51_05235 [Bacteroidales bacterium]|nr:hypothetical protein [Bacteroidales bacterium]MBN2756563.1 hypothetical protein [Bacteroidales bacterium]